MNSFFEVVHYIDFIIFATLLYGVFSGVRRGLSGEIARLFALAAGLLLGWRFSGPVSEWLQDRTAGSPAQLWIAVFVIILAGIYGLSILLRMAIGVLMEFTFKGRVEKFGGALCGLLRTAALILIVFCILGALPQSAPRRAVLEESKIGHWTWSRMYPYLEDLHYPLAPQPVRNKLDELGVPDLYPKDVDSSGDLPLIYDESK